MLVGTPLLLFWPFIDAHGLYGVLLDFFRLFIDFSSFFVGASFLLTFHCFYRPLTDLYFLFNYFWLIFVAVHLICIELSLIFIFSLLIFHRFLLAYLCFWLIFCWFVFASDCFALSFHLVFVVFCRRGFDFIDFSSIWVAFWLLVSVFSLISRWF